MNWRHASSNVEALSERLVAGERDHTSRAPVSAITAAAATTAARSSGVNANPGSRAAAPNVDGLRFVAADHPSAWWDSTPRR